MRLSGIGEDHGTDRHHVTHCLHGHGHAREGGLKISSGPGEAARQVLQEQQEQHTQLTLTDWAKKLFRSARDKLLGFWRGNDVPSEGQAGENTDASRTMAQLRDKNDANVAISAESAKQDAFLQQNAYFAAVGAETPGAARLSFGQRIKMKCRKAAGQMADHLPGRFLGRFGFQKNGSFQAGKDNGKEDLRRKSRYREDSLEIECILTDESYLLDSYDRKGEYSRLTTRK